MAVQDPLPQAGRNVLITLSVFLIMAIGAVSARFYARSITRKAIGLDDHLIVAGLVGDGRLEACVPIHLTALDSRIVNMLQIVTTATIGVGFALVLNGGVGLHMSEATLEQQAITLKLFVAAPLLWAIATSLVKTSILCFYITIFTMPRIRAAVYVVITLTLLLLFAVLMESFLLCRPFAYTWEKTIEGGVCGNSRQAYLSIAIINLVIDLSVVFLPMPVLWKLQMPATKKMSISLILGLGLVICGFTAARIKSVLDLDPVDFTHTVVPDLIFGGLEIELGIVNACLPILRPLFRKKPRRISNYRALWPREPRVFRSPPATASTYSKTAAMSNPSLLRPGHDFGSSHETRQATTGTPTRYFSPPGETELAVST